MVQLVTQGSLAYISLLLPFIEFKCVFRKLNFVVVSIMTNLSHQFKVENVIFIHNKVDV